MNFKTLILLSLILLGGICTGCDRFLDVQPKDQYTEKQLLATRGGYYTAMNGLYNNLTSNSLYGKNLSYELIDVISKRYAPLAKSTYLTSLNSWGYAEENVSKALESTWATAYTTILNCNVILENLATQQGILSPAETNLMKGELLALRAFLHFDMLRLFGPIYKEDPSAPIHPLQRIGKNHEPSPIISRLDRSQQDHARPGRSRKTIGQRPGHPGRPYGLRFGR